MYIHTPSVCRRNLEVSEYNHFLNFYFLMQHFLSKTVDSYAQTNKVTVLIRLVGSLVVTQMNVLH